MDFLHSQHSEWWGWKACSLIFFLWSTEIKCGRPSWNKFFVQNSREMQRKRNEKISFCNYILNANHRIPKKMKLLQSSCFPVSLCLLMHVSQPWTFWTPYQNSTEFERWGRSVRYYYFPVFKDKRQSFREVKLIFSQLREKLHY